MDLAEGGQRACVLARTSEERDGSTQASKTLKVCGRSEAERVFWTQDASCDWKPGCTSWALQLEGFKSNESVAVLYEQNGGSCGHEADVCNTQVYIANNGRGTASSWRFGSGYAESFTGTAGGLLARIPF